MKKHHLLAAVLAATLLLIVIPSPVEATTYVVTNTNDTGTGSLRWAITQAAANAGPDTIVFNIPTTDGGYKGTAGIWTIKPQTSLPDVTDQTTIDGTSQTAFAGNLNPYGPEVVLDGSDILAIVPIGLDMVGDLNQVSGLVVNYFNGAGIRISLGMTNTVSSCYIGTDHTGGFSRPNGVGVHVVDLADWNTIGGDTTEEGNLISGNTTDGILLEGVSYANSFLRNFIGTDRTGNLALPNGGDGIHVSGPAAVTLFLIADSLISGNDGCGIRIEGADTKWARIWGNTIGLNASQTAKLPNKQHGVGIYGAAPHNPVGYALHEPNSIAGNDGHGVVIDDSDTTVVNTSYIGTNKHLQRGLGNKYHGILISDSNDCAVHTSTIAHNGAMGNSGVRVEGAAIRNQIIPDSIYSNGGKGIFLFGGGNNHLPAPSINEASCEKVEGTTCSDCKVHIWSDWEDEGRHYEGYVTADSSGTWEWTGELTGPRATTTTEDFDQNTSEFSQPVFVGCYKYQHLPVIRRMWLW